VTDSPDAPPGQRWNATSALTIASMSSAAATRMLVVPILEM
jgi:hypothetical protein